MWIRDMGCHNCLIQELAKLTHTTFIKAAVVLILSPVDHIKVAG
jgi:hypothetical protein